MDSINKESTQFAKSDKGKLEISLVPTQIIRDIAEVRMYGTSKYNASSNWILIDKERYKNAMMRHILAYLDDEDSIDKDSGLPHYKHIACNLAFLCEMKRPDWNQRRDNIIQTDSKLQEQIAKYNDKAKGE